MKFAGILASLTDINWNQDRGVGYYKFHMCQVPEIAENKR